MRLFILFFYFVFLALAGAEVYAQIPPPPPPPPPEEAEILCYETIEAWERDPSMREYLSTHNCDCSDGATRPPVCTPVPTPEPKPPVQPAVTPPPVVSQPTQPAVIPPKPTSPPASAPVSGGRPRGNETPANPPVVAPAAPRPTSYPFKGQTLNTAQDLEEVKKRIEELTHEIAGMKVALNGFSRTLLNNNSEFEKWAQTADEAAASATKNLKSFGMDLFLEYCLFAKV